MDEMKKVTEENRTEAIDMNKRMTKRILEIEKEMKRSLAIRKETNNLRQKEQDLQDQPVGRNEGINQTTSEINYTSDWAKQLAAMDKSTDNSQVPVTLSESAQEVTPSHWMERLNVQNSTDRDNISGTKEPGDSWIGWN